MGDREPIDLSRNTTLSGVSDSMLELGLGLLTLLSRIPFLGAGYGSDPDAWRLAAAARHIARSWEYEVSRFPGYPIPEFALALVADYGPWAINGLTALMSVAATVFTARTARALGYRHWIWAGIGVAFLPVIYIHSVDAMDYVWALAFITASLYLAILKRPLWAGAALGLAIGCRLTSAIATVPIVLITLQQQQGIRGLLQLTGGATLPAVAAYAPVLHAYGWNFLTFYDSPYPDLLTVVKRMTLGVFGRMGLWAVVVSAIGAWFVPRIFRGRPAAVEAELRRMQTACWIAVMLWVVLFLLLPHDPGYLIPAAPFGLLILARWLNPRVLVTVCIVLLAGCLGQVCRSYGVCPSGVLAAHRDRVRDGDFVASVRAEICSLPRVSTVVVGWWQPQIEGDDGSRFPEGTKIVYLLDSAGLTEANQSGRGVYYLPEVVSFNRQREGIDLGAAGGIALTAVR